MLRVANAEPLIGREVRLVQRTTHFDRAGETSDARLVRCNMAGVDATGTAVLAADEGIHVLFPLGFLYPVAGDVWIGGQELVRDFHNAVTPVTLRWMDRQEAERELRELGEAPEGE